MKYNLSTSKGKKGGGGGSAHKVDRILYSFHH
jgi:hypothetical protein